MLVLLDVEVLEEAMEHSDIGIVDDPVTSFRDALKKAALFYFEKGNAPDAQALREAALRQQLSDAVDRIAQLHIEQEELRTQLQKLGQLQSAAKVAERARARRPHYECTQCHKQLQVRYHPGVLVPEEEAK